MKSTTFAAVLLASTLIVAPAFAQTASQHEEHHPQPSGAAAPAAPSRPDMSGMMKMMGDGMDMSGMMRMMSRMHAGMSGCMRDSALDHIEGRIAYLRTELHITDAQPAAWNAFADALRGQTQESEASPGGMTERGGIVDRIDRQERGLTTKLDRVRALKAAFTPLFSALSDEQRKAADQLLGSYFGMPMMGMSSVMDGGMMQGEMKPGAAMPMSGMGR